MIVMVNGDGGDDGAMIIGGDSDGHLMAIMMMVMVDGDDVDCRGYDVLTVDHSNDGDDGNDAGDGDGVMLVDYHQQHLLLTKLSGIAADPQPQVVRQWTGTTLHSPHQSEISQAFQSKYYHNQVLGSHWSTLSRSGSSHFGILPNNRHNTLSALQPSHKTEFPLSSIVSSTQFTQNHFIKFDKTEGFELQRYC